MPSESETPGRVTLRAIGPQSGEATEVLISHRRMHAVAQRSLGQAKECGILVPHTLQHPTAIFEGLRKDEDEDQRAPGWYCYCSKPPYSFDENGEEQPPYPGQVFLVFVNRERSPTIGAGLGPAKAMLVCLSTMKNDLNEEHYENHEQ